MKALMGTPADPPGRVDSGALFASREPRVGMGRSLSGGFVVRLALPVGEAVRHFIGHASHHTSPSTVSHIGEDAVLGMVSMALGLVLNEVPGATPKKPDSD